MRRLGLLLVALLLVLAAAPAQAQEGRGPVLVVGVPGLRWSDVGPQTPALDELAREGAVGALSVKAVPPVSCPADGWLTLGAGSRAVAAGVRREPCGPDVPPLRSFAEQVEANEQEREGAELGALARALGGCVTTTGAGAQLAAATAPGLGVAGEPSCSVHVAALPAVTGEGTGRASAALAADRALGSLLLARPASHVLVVGLSAGPGEDTAALHVAIARGEAFPPGALRSASTRRAPYVQLIDVAPTVLELVDVAVPEAMSGEPWRSVGQAPTPAELADLAVKAQAQKAVTVPFFVTLLAGELLLILLALRLGRLDLAELLALGGVAAMGASYVANLVPWWRSPVPLLTLLAVVVVVATAVVAVASSSAAFHRWGHERLLWPVGVVCAFTAGVLLLDLVTGAHLQMSSVAGYSPLVAGRFAGIGNVAFGVLAASVLLATAALTRSAAVVTAVALVTVAVDGAPPWGSDVGGVLALVPAFVLLAMLLTGRRVSVLRLVAAVVGGALVVAAFALADWARAAEDRTHLGRFVQDLVDGTAGTVLRRKAEAILDLLFANVVTALLPLVVALVVYLVLRPPGPLATAFDAAPAWRSGLVATGLATAIGFAVNDSGPAVAALAVVVAAPATIAVVLRARRAPEEPASLLA